MDNAEYAWSRTRRTLLSRLRDLGDDSSWREFFNIYSPLIYSVAVKSGLDAGEAQDVVQETMTSVFKKIPEFQYDPKKDSFKGWLLKLTRFRIINQFKKRKPAFRHGAAGDESTDDERNPLERVATTDANDLEAIWEREWQQHVINTALKQLKKQVRSEHYEIFYLHVIKDLPAAEVAKRLGVTVAKIYLIKYRLSKELTKIIRSQQKGFVFSG